MQYAVLVALCLAAAAPAADILDYVSAPDASYQWSVGTSPYPTLVNLNLTSQTWQGIPWQHTLSVFRPQKVTTPDLAVLFITGGHFGASPELLLGAQAAQQMGVPFAVLWDIPNQPLWGMREDDLIAHTFEEYLETKDPSWPLLFPMAKSAVRAMDALTAWSKQAWGQPVTRFITTGASKRGWTTWFTAAVDPRVVALMPMVYDNLNLAKQMPHQLELWGKFSPQIDDYTRRGLQAKLQTPEGQVMAGMVDPFTYRERIRQPKLIINGTNDAYWTLDALNLYRDELCGETWQIYVPNAGHSLRDIQKVIASTTGFVRTIAGNQPRPQFSWTHEAVPGTAKLTIHAPAATAAVLWTAMGEYGQFTQAQWSSTPMTKAGDGFTGSVAIPDHGDLAVFGEATFTVDGDPWPVSTTLKLYRRP